MTDRLSEFLAGKGLQLRRMDDNHYVEFFDCGRDDNMTKWFCTLARKWQDEDMCAVWVASPLDNDAEALGFFTLSAHQIIPGNVVKGDKASHSVNRSWIHGLTHPYPAQLLGKFALDRSRQGTGLGALMMLSVYAKHVEAADVSGAKFLVLDVRDDQLVAYYQRRYGFVRSGLPGEMAQMYRPTSVIRRELREVFGD